MIRSEEVVTVDICEPQGADEPKNDLRLQPEEHMDVKRSMDQRYTIEERDSLEAVTALKRVSDVSTR